jgi:hypothetical protein
MTVTITRRPSKSRQFERLERLLSEFVLVMNDAYIEE